MIPRATYRLQLHAGFTFADAAAQVPYLDTLGISHVYASPITVAAPGSTHGYDVVDPTRVSPELGGEEGLRDLVGALRTRGMGLVIDIVPNHMGVAGDSNAWWIDVLRHGRASRYAPVFDIDRDGDAPIVLPVLGTPLAEALAAGDVRLAPRLEGACAPSVRLYGKVAYPLRPDDPALAGEPAAVVARHDPATAAGRAALAALLARQHYRLTWWRAANDCLNWRRFFAINELAAVRAEDPAVFALTHALYLRLYRDGLIDGVRVDHVDGLTDPAGYCRTLHDALRDAAPDRGTPYVVVEKILAADEHLPRAWPVAGTSGYDFMREVSGLLHDPAGEAPLRTLWCEASGDRRTYHEIALAARAEVLAHQFDAQLCACVAAFVALARALGATELTPAMLRRAIAELLQVFPVYRTYGDGRAAPAADAPVREEALAAARRLPPFGPRTVAATVLGWLAGEGAAAGALATDAVRRFQQLAAPIAAKGVEDTAFYRYGALLSWNDVGFEPDRPSLSIADFHAAMARRARDWPHAMLATATHDHKRGPDARARLAVLSGIPAQWARRLNHWRDLVAPYAQGVHPADLVMLLQSLLGAWRGDGAALSPRLQAWQVKALREAQLRSSWNDPDEDYEARCTGLAATLLTGPAGEEFRDDLAAFVAAIAPAARANTLLQTALHYTLPGVPDCYQGCELADDSFVDPDNRRAVDFAARAALLARVQDEPAPRDLDAAKLRLIADLLARRRADPDLFARAGYRPLAVSGPRAGHVLGFAREQDGRRLTCLIATRLGEALFGGDRIVPDAAWWGDTWIDAEADAEAGRVGAAQIFATDCVYLASPAPLGT